MWLTKVENVATACFFLACKVEERTQKLNDTLKACWHLMHKDEGEKAVLYIDDPEFSKYKAKVLYIERLVLEILQFKLTIPHPYTWINVNLDKMGLMDRRNDIFSTSWCTVNDR